MQVHLIYNPNAGISGASVEELQEALHQVGFSPVYQETNTEEDLDPILSNANGLIVAAGGDGTVRAVLNRLIGTNLPLTILPMGTANNIAKSLKIPINPLEIIAGLKERRSYLFDVGHVKAPWGEDYFFEGAGFGFFADVLAAYGPEQGKSIWRGLGALGNILLKGHVYSNCIHLNGEEISGEFLLIEVLNTSAIGPRLKFAPDASPQDGLLNLVCIEASDRAGFLQYLTGLINEDLHRLETVTERRVNELSFAWNGFPFHVDGEIRPLDWYERHESEETEFGIRSYLPEIEAGEITIKVLPAAVTLWLPAEETA
jgi:diacylglycerol kinase family enzyme